MTLVLYDNPLSSNALKARFLLAELGLEYERREVPFDEPRPPWLTEFHPFGRIPALDDDGFRLGGSNTILRYLASSLSNNEIASELYVSITTVKTHQRAVYRKLDAKNRRDAVRRARTLELL